MKSSMFPLFTLFAFGLGDGGFLQSCDKDKVCAYWITPFC